MLLLLTALFACDRAEPVEASAPWPDEPPTTLTPLDDPRPLRRMSLDLRGTLPTAAELDAVAADPAALTTYRDAWLDDPALEERLVALFAEQWHTEIDTFLVLIFEYPHLSDPTREYAAERAIGDEPLRLMARIAVEDRPWTEVVTADYTVVDDTLLSIWPLEALEDGEGLAEARYTDGRPAAGVLATNGLWWRYFSTVSNYNRGRVAALARLLVCEDYLSRPVTFAQAPALADEDGIEGALRSDPYCQGCHSSIDPIAASLFGFWAANEYNVDEIGRYHPEREPLGARVMDVAPAWYGQPVSGLAELAVRIAEDPRFDRCAVERFAQGLWRREVVLEDFNRVERLRLGFAEEGLRVKPLLAAILDTPEYRAGGHTEASDDATLEREMTTRLLTPRQLTSALEDLSGFRWVWDGYDQLDNDVWGYRVLAGGVDGEFVTRPQEAPSFTQAVVLQRLSEAAARAIVERDLLGSGDAVLDGVDGFTRPEDPAFRPQLERLHWRLYAQAPDDARLDACVALWTEVAAAEDNTEAWVALLSAMLRDPDFISY